MKAAAAILISAFCALAMFDVVWARGIAWNIMSRQTQDLISASITDPCNDMMHEVFEVSIYDHWRRVMFLQDPYTLYSHTLAEYGRQGAKAWIDTADDSAIIAAWNACFCNPVDSDPSVSEPVLTLDAGERQQKFGSIAELRQP